MERVLEARKVKDGDCGCEKMDLQGLRSLLVRAPSEKKRKKEKKERERETSSRS